MEARPATDDAFARELVALKAQNGGQRISDEAITALLSKYRMPNPLLAAPLAAQPDPVLEETEVLRKSAAGSVYIPVRKANFDVNMTMYLGVNLEPGAAFDAWTAGSAGNLSVDPLLIAYYRTGGDDIGSTIKVVAMNDDDADGGLDPYIYWANNTGAALRVEVVAYAYSIGTSGNGTVKIRTNLTRSYAGRIGGVNQVGRNATSAKPLDGCSYNSDVLIMTRNANDAEPGFFIGVNYAKKKGAILGSDNTLGGADKTTVTLPIGLSTGWPDFVLSFNPWRAGSLFNASPYTAIQYQKYSCR